MHETPRGLARGESPPRGDDSADSAAPWGRARHGGSLALSTGPDIRRGHDTSRKATAVVEVRIGVQNVAREITFESSSEAADITAAVGKALSGGGVLQLEDEKGKTIVVPAAVLGYVQVGESEKGRVGFSTHP